MRLFRDLMSPRSSCFSSMKEAWMLCSGIGQKTLFSSDWTGLCSCGVLAPPTLSNRRSLFVMPLSQESVFLRDISSWDLVLSGSVSMDSAFETLLHESAFTTDSLKRPQPLALGGSADLQPTRFPFWVAGAWSMTRLEVLDEEDAVDVEEVVGVAMLSVTMTILVEAKTAGPLGGSREMAPFSTSLAPWFACSLASRASLCCRKRWKSRRTGWSGGRFRGASFFLFNISSSSRFTSLIFRKTICKKTGNQRNCIVKEISSFCFVFLSNNYSKESKTLVTYCVLDFCDQFDCGGMWIQEIQTNPKLRYLLKTDL